MLLTRLHDIAKSRISNCLYKLVMPPEFVMESVRQECLVTSEAARRLTLQWGVHPLLGRMYMPIYEIGTRTVAELLDTHGFAKAIPALYGVYGPVDCVTIREVVASLPT